VRLLVVFKYPTKKVIHFPQFLLQWFGKISATGHIQNQTLKGRVLTSCQTKVIPSKLIEFPWRSGVPFLGMSQMTNSHLWDESKHCDIPQTNFTRHKVIYVKDMRGKWYCCNLSGGVALIVWFTTNGMCVKNNTIIYGARASNSKRDCEHDLYCCLLPRCEALRTCRSGFPIAIILITKGSRQLCTTSGFPGNMSHVRCFIPKNIGIKTVMCSNMLSPIKN